MRFIAASSSPAELVAPAPLAVRVGQPRVEPVVRRRPSSAKIATSSQAVPRAPREAAGRARRAARGRSPPRSSTIHATATTHAATESAISAPRQPPSTRGERHRDRRGHGRADLDPRRVDAGPRRRALGHRVAHDERRERVPEPHPDPDRQREQDDEPGARDDRARDAEQCRSAPARSSSRAASRAARRGTRRPARRAPCRARGSSRAGRRARGRRRGRPGCRRSAGRRRRSAAGARARRGTAPRARRRSTASSADAGPRSGVTRLRAMRANASTCLRASRPAGAGLAGADRLEERHVELGRLVAARRTCRTA